MNFGGQQTQQGTVFVMLVSGEDLPNTYPVQLGCTGIFIDFTSGKFWVKENPSGVPRPLRIFSFKEETPQPMIPASGTGSFVSREEFSALANKIDQLINDLGGAK